MKQGTIVYAGVDYERILRQVTRVQVLTSLVRSPSPFFPLPARIFALGLAFVLSPVHCSLLLRSERMFQGWYPPLAPQPVFVPFICFYLQPRHPS